jgi:hypothetical protein
MSLMSAMPQNIAAWLSAQPNMSDVTVLTEFPAQPKPVPLRKSMVTVGFSDLKIKDIFDANNDGVLQKQEYCRTAEIRLGLGIYVPYAAGGAACYDVLTRTLDLLTFATDLNLTQSGSGRVEAKRDADAYVLQAYANLTADFCPAETTGLDLPSFLPKDLLCGTHISDTQIHLTAQEKAWLSTNSYAGTYLGNGLSTQTVALPTLPKAVQVFAKDVPPFATDSTTGVVNIYMGFATIYGATAGLALVPAGFTLSSAAKLNAAGTEYCYFAWI